MSLSPNHVIVVGGALAGLSAAHTIIEQGGSVLVLDKNGFFGGNSTKATSGINGALTRTQAKLKVPDSAELFFNDTVKSARDLARPDLIKVLTYQSASGVEWLQDKFGLGLDQVARLGGHSEVRTHRSNTEMFPGMEITYALMEKMEDLAEQMPERVKIIKKARVTQLLKEGDKVVGVEYEFKGKQYKDLGPVVLATGGYAADFGSNSLLEKHRPELMGLSTTNGNHCTGDGHKMIMSIGGKAIDMEKVQVHPTGLVDPTDPKAKVKFLAAEALRGSGGILLDANGDRFCDELGHRDYVTGMMNKNKFPIRLILNGKSTKAIEWHCKHYTERRLMKKFTSGADVAKEIGCSPEHLAETFKKYTDIAAGKEKDPWNKRFFHNAPYTMEDDLWHVALMEPVLHYTMGGVEINDKSEVIAENGKPIDGLFACGELAGGVHGANRLGGSSLLGCVVFGRVAGASASSALLQKLSSGQSAAARLGQISNHINLSIDPNTKSINISFAEGGAAVAQAQQQPQGQSDAVTEAVSEKAEKQSTDKEYTLEEVAKHKSKDDVWLAVRGKVLDVTEFLEDHPGGVQSLMLQAGRECTEAFEMMHAPGTLEKHASHCIIGTYKQ
ncbi:putative OSM1-fumarate reductase [Protomyces lactucae-debilis]|uniref:Putative OSM1-fumarate reductase n=1 Tax=Protomyces lactucae-debilis TaxID=2754530 RepID=A0A1Y2F9R7_PROLT|nr:putative OSM1-fumarate reductase [Protomyces lactucae-debilis]ORY80377.1 putative OSM1-fumarate reductase [Protomyces lactucae-debilis]